MSTVDNEASKAGTAVRKVASAILWAIAFVAYLTMRALRPLILIRIKPLISERIGHFAANTDLYLCELEAGINRPTRRFVDLFYPDGPVANQQLALMWRRRLRFGPGRLLGRVYRLNRSIRGGCVHEIPDTAAFDRDVSGLWARMPPHLSFTNDEIQRGETALRALGVPQGGKYVCLIVRDGEYLKTLAPNETLYQYHDYRDSNIQNYVAAAEALADRGFYVIRMGAVVKSPMPLAHPKVIDYATNGMRSDFMDVFLGARCAFCLSVGTGFDAIPLIFRRPVGYVNFAPIGYLPSFIEHAVIVCKKLWRPAESRWLSLPETFESGIAFCISSAGYEAEGAEIVENSPDEIREVAVEMAERLEGTWRPAADDDDLQRRFWENFPQDGRSAHRSCPLHGTVRARYGAQFLRSNREWIDGGRVTYG